MACKYDHEYKVQAVKLAKEIGGAKAAKELGIPEVSLKYPDGVSIPSERTVYRVME